MVNGSFLLID